TPKISTASGINATDGTGRINSIVELVALRKKFDEPIINPRTAAATTAITIPINQARIVSQTATQNTWSASLPNKSAIAAEAGGINRLSTIPTNGNNSHITSNNTIQSKPRKRLAPVLRLRRTA